MSVERTVASLARLTDLRKRELDRTGAELAERQAEQRRHRANLVRLQALADELPEVRAGHPAMAVNGGDYKAMLFATIRDQSARLEAHEHVVAQSQAKLVEAMRRHRSLSAVLERRRNDIAQARDARSRKREDERATLAWLRRRNDQGRSFNDM